MHQAPVGLACPEQDGDAFERRATEGGVDHRSDRSPHLVVGVGGGQHAGGAIVARDRTYISRRRLDTEAGERASHAGVGSLRAGDADDDGGGACLGHGGDETGLPLEQILREMDDDVPELAAHPGRLASRGVERRFGQIGLVVPALAQDCPRLPAQAHHVGGPASSRRQPLETTGRDVGQFPEGGHQRGLGSRVLGHRREQTRVATQHLAQGGSKHRGRHRAALLGCQAGRPEQLGQPVGGEERHRRHARTPSVHRTQRAARQRPPGGHADVVGGHDHRHGGQGIALLGCRNGASQRQEGGASIRSGHDVEGHVARLCTRYDSVGR